MKFTYLAAFFFGASLVINAQGYKDGIEYYKAGQYDNAITILTKNMNSSDTDKSLANYYLGQAYLNKGELAQARNYFEAGINANPECGYNYVGLGAIDLLNKNKSAAEDNFNKAQKFGKKNSEITIDIARAYYNADPVGYEKEINKLVEKARKDSKNQEPAIYIFEGDRMTKERNFNEAAQWYDQAINFDGDNPEGYVKYANTYFYVVPDYAIKKLEELLSKQPNSALAQRELAEKYYENRQYTRATAQYAKYMENPNHFAQDKSRYVVLLFADNKYEDAIKNAREVLASENTNDLTLSRIILYSLIELKRDEEALTTAEKFFNTPDFKGRFNSNDYQVYADLLLRNDKPEEAVAVLKNGVASLPDELSLLKSLASLQSKVNKEGDGFKTFQLYLSRVAEPTTEDYDLGSRYAMMAVAAEKENETLRNEYATAGLDYLNKIIDPQNPNANYLLRKVQIYLNRNLGVVDDDSAVAIQQLIDALDKNPENSDPKNENNSLNVYKILYMQLVSYYDVKGDKESKEASQAKLQKTIDLIQQQ